MYDSRVIANKFLELAKKADWSLTPMQLLKLVYIAHGWMLGLHGRPLIKEKVEAWQYGPVIRSLYDAIRSFKSNPVEGLIDLRDAPGSESIQGNLNHAEEKIVKDVFEGYGKLSALTLSRITHKKGSPWDRTYRPGSFGVEIPNDFILEYYTELAKRANAA